MQWVRAAKTDSGPCVTYIGDLGSGNYVKMIHNGIEYGDMQVRRQGRACGWWGRAAACQWCCPPTPCRGRPP